MNQLVSIPDAAKQVLGGVGESTLRRWIGEGRIPVVRLGRRLFIRTQVLEEFIKAGEEAESGLPPRPNLDDGSEHRRSR